MLSADLANHLSSGCRYIHSINRNANRMNKQVSLLSDLALTGLEPLVMGNQEIQSSSS